jgi:pimeloyl-ACP methyl ester carboxylesterase
MIGVLEEELLPAGMRARFIDGINGLRLHYLEAGFETPDRPLLLLLHGFPELAYSWRKVMPPLAAAGFHVVAPDQRGYGRTTGWDADYDGDLAPYRLPNLVEDAATLAAALGHRSAEAVVGHDFGSAVAAWGALLRPAIFRRLVLMSTPFGGVPRAAGAHAMAELDDALGRLDPPRKHYQRYFSTRAADGDMRHSAQGVHAFLRAYFHMKSADWPGNRPVPLKAWDAAELAQMPAYYIMPRDQTMAEAVAPAMPSPGEIAACRWLSDADLSVYSEAYARTGFQGGLHWYRCGADPACIIELSHFAGRTIDVPTLFIGGAADWGVQQAPGAFIRMQKTACTRFAGAHLIDGAGHWVQQEQPAQVTAALLDFLAR